MRELVIEGVKFIHHRPFIEYLSKDGKPSTKIYYNQATIAYTKPEGGKCLIAFSRCNNKDNYNKHIGRTIAANRLTRDALIVDVEPGKHIQNITAFVKDIINRAYLSNSK